MKIAILAPLKRAITPDTTVSRNRVIVDLVTGLTGRGHTITIFGTEGSHLPGVTVVPITKPLTELPPAENEFYQHTSYLAIEIAEVLKHEKEFDLIHNHMYPEYLVLSTPFTTPLVTTVHSQMTPLTAAVLREFPDAHLVAISEMAKVASGRDMDVVHNSVDTDFFLPAESSAKGGYLLAVGRMSKAKDSTGKFLDPKGIGNAIAVAERSGLPLKIVGNVEDPEFFETIVKPHLSNKIEFVGNVSPEQSLSRAQMRELFAGAKAFINPINWDEPFGLVMAEALSCGTPVIAFNRGAVSEIVTKDVGFVVETIDAMVDALKHIDTINSSTCRDYAVANFSTKRMVEEYEKVYKKYIK